jgi:pyruvate formate lyase activating enzyme
MNIQETTCKICEKKSALISKSLNVCIDCLREESEESFSLIHKAHAISRSNYDLPPHPLNDVDGLSCNICANKCKIGKGRTSYCGLKRNNKGFMESLSSPNEGILHHYLDRQVTNCCSAWFCPAGTKAGYPKYSYKAGPEYGYYNLALFFYGCNFNCLFCQNEQHKNISVRETVTVNDLVATTEKNPSISCWCFFGGSPEPQLPFAIEASKSVLKKTSNRIVRICFEWNGCGNPQLVRKAAELSLKSGGNIKFDLKCFNPSISYALSGVSNKTAFENFKMIGQDFYPNRADLPLLTATTLLVPGYVDPIEVEQIAEFIADINTEIPYSLLIFHPAFMMTDLPITPLKQVKECFKVSKKHLKNVHIGNLHMLGLKNV